MPKHHTIISGTGRAGTTFLVQLLTQLGIDTGFTDTTSAVYSNCNAGMELDIRQPNAPYIVKSPFLCDYLDEIMESGEIVIDHAIIPVRDLFSAAQSRRHISETTDHTLYNRNEIPGGLWYTEDPSNQETVLTWQLYKIIYAITKHNIPVTLLHFPQFVREPEYLYQKLNVALGGIDEARFMEAFRAVSRPELVHDFKPSSGPSHATSVRGDDASAKRTPLLFRLAGKLLSRPRS